MYKNSQAEAFWMSKMGMNQFERRVLVLSRNQTSTLFIPMLRQLSDVFFDQRFKSEGRNNIFSGEMRFTPSFLSASFPYRNSNK